MARPSGERFDMGRVFSGTIDAISANWMAILGITVVAGILSAAANTVVMGNMAASLDAANVGAISPLSIFTSWPFYVSSVGGLLISAFAQSAIMQSLFARDAGGAVTPSDVMMGGLRFVLPLTGLTILWWIAISIGFVLLFVPGAILITMWSVCVPVLIGENSGVMAAFGRSRALTKGIRWAVFGTLLLFGLGLGFISTAFQGFSTAGLMQLYQTNIVLASLVGVLLFAVQTALLSAFLYALYAEVRLVNEGKAPESLAEIFA
jgi:uncharacterized membrane protein